MSPLSLRHSSSNLVLHTSLALFLHLILSYLRIPALFLYGLNTYIHPDDVNPTNKSSQGARAVIRRPGMPDSDFKSKRKSKEKIDFDESKAQIFRLKLNDSQLATRVYFNEFCGAFNSAVVAASCLLLHKFLSVSKDSGVLANGSLIPVLLGIFAVFRIFILIARVSFERSASKLLEKQLSFILGVLGFVVGLVIVFEIVPKWVLDFRFESLDSFGKISVAIFMGCIVGFLYIPALRNGRDFWLGTDQIRCNLSIISCGWSSRMILYASHLLVLFTSLLWINPFTELLVNKNIDNRKGPQLTADVENTEKLIGNVGLSRSEFEMFRLLCLLISGLLQVVILRPNVQTYLNEAVLCWYQRLHASKVPDMDYSRAKVFLHNHYLCLVVVQFFAPPALVLLFLGLSQIDANLFGSFQIACHVLPCSVFAKEVALFIAWWIVFVWATFTSGSLALYRHGILYVL